MLIGTRILQVPHVDDDADVLRTRSDAYVELGAEVVNAGDLDRAAVEVALVFGGVAECVYSPATIGVVWIEVVDMDMLRRDWRICGARAGSKGEETGEDNDEAY